MINSLLGKLTLSRVALWLVLAAATAGTAYGLGYAAAWVDPVWIFASIVGILLAVIIYKQPLAGVALLAFFLPFERIGSVDIASITIRISQVIALLTITAWLWHGLLKKRIVLQPNPTWLPISLFVLICLVALLNAPYLERSISVVVFTLFTIIVSLTLPNILTKKEHITNSVRILLFSMLLVCMFGLYQFLGDLIGLPPELTGLREQYTKAILGFPRIQSTALEPLYFANYLLIPLSLALAFFLGKSKSYSPLWLLGLLSIGTLNLVLTVSRGGYIAFAVVLACLGLLFWREAFRPRNVISVLLIVIVVGGLAYRFLNVEEQVDSFTTHVTNLFDGASYIERVETFEIAERIWQQHPWIGIGPGSFGPYASSHPLLVPSQGYRIVNNEYIELLAETGILGLLCIIVMMAILVLRSIKAYRAGTDTEIKLILVGLQVAMIGILVQYNTFSILYIMHIWWTIGMIVAAQNYLLASHAKK